MDNETLLKALDKEGGDQAAGEQAQDVEYQKLLLFSMEESIFAISADLVREIAIGATIYRVPFAPPFVRGLINRHGDPYTVIDLKVLIQGETVQADQFLMLKVKDDQLAVLISDVVEITKFPVTILHPIQEREGSFFSASFRKDDKEVLVVDVKAVTEYINASLSQ